jgi:hypothetical protein
MGPIWTVVFVWPLRVLWFSTKLLLISLVLFCKGLYRGISWLLRRKPEPPVHGDATWASLKDLKKGGHLGS